MRKALIKYTIPAALFSALFFHCGQDKARNEATNTPDSLQRTVPPKKSAPAATAWEEAAFEIVTPGYKTFTTGNFGHVFSGSKNNIVRIAPELDGLTGVKLPAGKDNSVKLRFREPVKVLIGTFRDNAEKSLEDAAWVLDSALTITGLPPVRVYARAYPAGTHTIDPEGAGRFALLGVVKGNQQLTFRNAGLPDGQLWDTVIVEGFSDEPPLFEIVGGPDQPVIAEGMPGTEEIRGGFEGGRCVKIGDTYHAFPTERAGEEGVAAYHDRVKTRIGHWTSKDAIHWERQSTLYESSGTYALTEGDHPMNDRRSAIWSFMPVFSEKANRWYGYYLAYTTHKEIEPNHSFGRIWRAESQEEGINGIGGPYRDIGIVMEPGLGSQPWEGRQGVASFFPYKAGDQWVAFYSGAYPFASWQDYPKNTGKGWYVGLAESGSLEGPWLRMDTTVNPVTSIHPWFVENPIVSRLPNGLYIAVFDGGPDGWGHHLPNMMAYTLSKNGYDWSEARYWPIETKVNKWWDIMRTPMCLIPEGNGVYTIVYAAVTPERFHPIGMVRVKLNEKVLEVRAGQLDG